MNDPVTRPMDELLEEEPMECENDIPPVRGMRQVGRGHSQRFEQNIDKSTGKKLNDALPWVVIGIVSTISCTLSGLAVGLQIRGDQLIEARVQAAIAPVNEVARTAAQNAKLAEDRANKIVAQLEAKGLIRVENH